MRILGFTLALSLAACQTSGSHAVVSTDPAIRTPLFEALSALEGRWMGETSEGSTGESQFFVSSGGTAVREIMMPGSDYEMTNMYTLHGNHLLMTHNCAAGNQPHMRATSLEGNRIVFEPLGVSDLKATDEYYMGAMTLVIIDQDNIEQRWASCNNGKRDDAHEMVISMKRVR